MRTRDGVGVKVDCPAAEQPVLDSLPYEQLMNPSQRSELLRLAHVVSLGSIRDRPANASSASFLERSSNPLTRQASPSRSRRGSSPAILNYFMPLVTVLMFTILPTGIGSKGAGAGSSGRNRVVEQPSIRSRSVEQRGPTSKPDLTFELASRRS